MTRFTVVWHREAHDELARLWMEAPDGAWSTDATAKGTSIPDRLRQLTVPPLRVLFAVSEADCMVRVLDVLRS